MSQKILTVTDSGSSTGNREAVIRPEVGCYAVKLRRWEQMDRGSRAGWNSLQLAHPRHLVNRTGDTGFNFYDHVGFTVEEFRGQSSGDSIYILLNDRRRG